MSNDSWIIIADDVPAGLLSAMARSLDGRVTATQLSTQDSGRTSSCL